MPTFAPRTVIPLHGLIVDALKQLNSARDDGDPEHEPSRCGGCLVCIRERNLNRLVDKLPRKERA